MIELVALLLPLAAFSGWFIARRGIRQGNKEKRLDLSSNYFKGLNFLLNEQPDKAIEVFIQMLEVDSETVETHLALGNLFRRRGEVDRAIRIHQNIIARPTLNRQQRAHALYELGQDYMSAGLLDRAESLFIELIDLSEYKTESLKQLLDIYEQEKDWASAIETAKKYAFNTGNKVGGVIAHYYCERAEKAFSEHDTQTARQMTKKAVVSDRQCVRASLLQAKLDVDAGDCKQAIRAYRNVEHQDPDFIAEVISPLGKCYRASSRLPEFKEYMQQILKKYGGVSIMLSLSELIKEEKGEKEATQFIIEQLRQRPSVRGLERLVDYNLQNAEGAARDNLQILNDLIKKLLTMRTFYKCISCGFEVKSLHWHCPSCKHWDTVKPLQDIVDEA